MKRIFVLVLLLVSSFSSLFAMTEREGYICWYQNDRKNNKTASLEEFSPRHTLASDTLPFGTKVRLTVNGITKDMVVTDRLTDEKASFAVGETAAKELGFFYLGRANVESAKVIEMGSTKSKSSAAKWYNVTDIYPKDEQNIIELFSELLSNGFKTKISDDNKYITVINIPGYRLKTDIEKIANLSSKEFKPREIEVENPMNT